MNAVMLAMLCAIGQTDQYAQDFHHDFRNAPLPDELWRQPGNYPMIFEKEGLRIKLPKDRKATGQVGVVTNFPVKGNFEITAAYEILHADQPTDGWGVGATLYVQADDQPGKNVAGIYRLNKVKGAQTIHWDRAVIRADGKRDYQSDRIECNARLFRLRMTRNKQTLTCFWAPGLSGDDFREIGKTEFVSDDLRTVTLNTTTGSKPYELDVRLVDLRIRSGVKSLSEPESAPTSVERVQRRWRLWLVILLFGVALSAGMLTLYLRRRRNAVNDPDAK
jgi:hypothetical protein